MLGSSTVPGASSSGRGVGIVRADDCDFVTTPTQFLIQEPCLKRCTVGVRDSREVAEDGNPQRPPVPRRQRRERAIRSARSAARGRPRKRRTRGARQPRCVRACAAASLEAGALAVKVLDVTEFYSERGGGVRSHLTLKGHVLCQLGHEHVVVAPGPGDATRTTAMLVARRRASMTRRRRCSATASRTATGSANARASRVGRARPSPYDPTYHLLWRCDKIRAIVARERPDVLEIHSPYIAAASALACARERVRRPHVPVALGLHRYVPARDARAARVPSRGRGRSMRSSRSGRWSEPSPRLRRDVRRGASGRSSKLRRAWRAARRQSSPPPDDTQPDKPAASSMTSTQRNNAFPPDRGPRTRGARRQQIRS